MNSKMRLGLVVGALCVVAASPGAEIVDQVLATVDTEAILQSEIMTEIAPYLNEIRVNSDSQEAFDEAVDERLQATLEQAIENKILLREALLAGLEVDDDVVDKQLADFKKLYASTDEFLKDLDKAGETVGDLRVRLRKQLLARNMGYRKHKEFEKSAVVSESEVAQYYQGHESEFNRPERVRCRQVFLATGPDAEERAEAKARLRRIGDALEAGADFAELAAAHSDAPGAEDGGIIGWVVRGDLVAALEEAVFSLPEGATSQIIETEGGCHILKVDTKDPGGHASLDEARTEVEPKLRSLAADIEYDQWMSELRKRSRVRVFY